MSGQLEVFDKTEAGYLAFDLIDFLQLIEDRGSTLTWAILDLELLGDEATTLNIGQLEQRVQNSTVGLTLTWNALIDIASRIKQTIDGTFVGCRSAETITLLDRRNLRTDFCEIVIRAIDSSYWFFYAKDDRLLDRIQRHFKDWREVDLIGPARRPEG